jgi:hypothetical protein
VKATKETKALKEFTEKNPQKDFVFKSIGHLLSMFTIYDFPKDSVFLYRGLQEATFSIEVELERIKEQFDLFQEIRLFLRVMFTFFQVRCKSMAFLSFLILHL